MKIGLTFDLCTDYGIEENSEVFADFCSAGEIGYLADAIAVCGYEVEMIGNMYHLNEQIINKTFDCDLVFVEDEGILSRNREAIVPALLELNHIPYVGSDAFVMALTQNKFQTKLTAARLGLRVPEELYLPYPAGNDTSQEADRNKFLFDRLEILRKMKEKNLRFPVIVKPNCEGYSMGVFLAENEMQLQEAVRFNFQNYKQEVLIEQFICGRELSVPIIGTGQEAYALNVEEVKYADGSPISVFSLQDKCFRPLLDEAADLLPETKQLLIDWGLLLYRHLGCTDFGRVDYKLDAEGKPYFLEINPRPGMTQDGPYETCAKSLGKTYEWVVGEVIASARKRYGL